MKITDLTVPLHEAPISDIQTIGDMDQEGSFGKSDLKKMQDPEWVKRVHNMFERAPVNIVVYIVNLTSELAQQYDIYNEPDTLVQAGPTTSFNQVEELFGFRPKDSWDNVTVILTNNEGDNKVGMTPWILGHRISHAIMYSYDTYDSAVQELSHSIADLRFLFDPRVLGKFNKKTTTDPLDHLNTISGLIGKTHSMRQGNLQNLGEFIIEALTQKLNTGTFSVRYTGHEDVDHKLEDIEETINYYTGKVLENRLGAILIL